LGGCFRECGIKDWSKGFQYFFSYPQSIKGRIKYFYYGLNCGRFRRTIRKIKPDIVHIQGIGVQIKPFIDVCEEERVPYIVTLHGLIGLDDTVRAASWDKQLERDFLIAADKKGISVTVISTGMKRRIEENYLGHEAKNHGCCNGTRSL
jgi:2-hydroxy-3-keto-5-methylthiopentenyl-1-phosphate phosphatase